MIQSNSGVRPHFLRAVGWVLILSLTVTCRTPDHQDAKVAEAAPDALVNAKYIAQCGNSQLLFGPSTSQAKGGAAVAVAAAGARGPSRKTTDFGSAVQAIFTQQRLMKSGGTKACSDCHNPNSDNGTDSFSNILNFDDLRSKGVVTQISPTQSPLYKILTRSGGYMPLGGKDHLSSDELATLVQWMNAGAPGPEPSSPTSFGFVSNADETACIVADLHKLPGEAQPFARYLTLTHFYNANLNANLELNRQALAKLVNSLSLNPVISNPLAVDPLRTIFRIDLRALNWTADTWSQVVATSPFGASNGSADAAAIAQLTGTPQAFLRGDFFIDITSKPPLYYSILGIPDTDLALEQQLFIDIAQDIANQTVIRAGFRQSGVSVNNRMIERHSTTRGYYWKSYDFATSSDNQNLYAHPLDFQKNGGEIIFSLPNGLQAYMLINAVGKRLDEGPINIVQDKKRIRDGFTVLNGESCFGCHVSGMIRHDDEIRPYVLTNPALFDANTKATVPGLYAEAARLTQAFAEDEQRYRIAVEATGYSVPTDSIDQIFQVAYGFEDSVGMSLAAAEVGLTQSDFLSRLQQHPDLQVQLGFTAAGGVVTRKTFLALFSQLTQQLNPDLPPSSTTGTPPSLASIDDLVAGVFGGVSVNTCNATVELQKTKTADGWQLSLKSPGAPGCDAFQRTYRCDHAASTCLSVDTSLTHLDVLATNRFAWNTLDNAGSPFEYVSNTGAGAAP